MMLKTIAVFVLVLLAVQTQCGTAWADFETGNPHRTQAKSHP
jgi:hypothetical protein